MLLSQSEEILLMVRMIFQFHMTSTNVIEEELDNQNICLNHFYFITSEIEMF